MTSQIDPVDALAVLLAGGFESMDSGDIAAGMACADRLSRFVAGCEVKMLQRTRLLHAAGMSPEPEAVVARSGASRARARRQARRATACSATPEITERLGSGSMSPEHADAFAKFFETLPADVAAALIARRPALIEAACRLSVDEYKRYLMRAALLADDHGSIDQQQRSRASLRRWIDPITGLYHLSGVFSPEAGTRLFGAVDAEVERLWRAATPESTMPLPDDKLAGMAAAALSNLTAGGFTQAHPGKTEVIVIVDLDTLRGGWHAGSVAEFHDGSQVAVSTARRLCCDAGIIPTVLGGRSETLDHGYSLRLASRAQRNSLRARHRTCAVPGCVVRFDHCRIHHLDPWECGGPTDLDNLVPVCSAHHHSLHEGRWRLEIQPDHSRRWIRPDGVTDSHAPPPTLAHRDWLQADAS